MRRKRIHIVTMGCQMNVYDSEQILRRLAPLGYHQTSHLHHADVVIVNTCSIREKAEHKVFSFLGRLAGMKQRNPHLMIGVAGCVAQQQGHRIIKRAPHVDIVFGTFAMGRLPYLLARAGAQTGPVVDIGPREDADALSIIEPASKREQAAAFVTIMQGCDNFCTYCVVPYVRGREVSRDPGEILEEIRLLVENGVAEVTLLGQNVNAYGKKNGHGCNFPELLRQVDRIRGLRRLRFTTSHPKDLSDQLIEAFGSLDKLVPHIHLPVQSGSDRVLKRMNRGYGRDFYLNKIEKLREARSDISITSDVMVGFPGEESVDYEDTLDLVRRVGFDSLFMFKYSDRPNVPAARFPKKIPDAVIGGRFSRLFGLQSELTLKKNKTLIGTVQEVLLEGHSKRMPDQLTGRTPCNRVVNFPDEGDSRVGVGQVLPVEIVEAFSHSLLGRRIAEAKREDAGAHGGMSHAA